MVEGKMKPVVVVLLALMFLAPTLSCAQSLELSEVTVNPNSVWVSDDYDIRFLTRCLYGGNPTSNADVRAEIFPPGYNSPTFSPVLPYNPSSGMYDYTLGPILNDVGTYTVKFNCKYSGQDVSTARQFTIHSIDLDIQMSSLRKLETFRGGQLVIPVSFKQDNQLVVPSQNTFNVKISGIKLKQVGVPQIKNGMQEITVDIPLEGILRDGMYDLEVTGYSQGESITDSVKDAIVINSPLNIKLLQKEIVCPKGSTCTAVIDAQVLFYDGYISDFTADTNFEAVLAGGSSRGVKVVYIGNVSCDDSSRICRIGIVIPANLDSDSYELFVTVAYPSISKYTYRSQDSMTLDTIIRLSGTLEDSRGSAVESTMTFTQSDDGKTTVFQSRGSGRYTVDLLPGRYDVDIKFATGVTAKYYDVDVSPSNLALLVGNGIRYDSGNVRGGGLEGLNPVAINVIEFGLPFSKGLILAPYDSSRVAGDERDLQVFACRNWNFMKSTCTGVWEVLPSRIHTIEDVAEFTVNSSGAFIVGEAKQIRFEKVEIINKEYSLNEPVQINGRIADIDGNLVEGATISGAFLANNNTVSATSGRDGRFSLMLNAPSTDGVTPLVLRLDKSPSVGEDYKTSINVVRRRELTVVDVPDVFEVELNKERKLQFNIFNSGQLNFTEPVYVHASGISSSWYNLAPLKINEIQVGERKGAELTVRVTDAMCGKDCTPYNLVNLEVKSGDYTQSMSFSLRIVSPVNRTSEVPQENGDLITGFMAAVNPSALLGGNLMYVAMIGVIAILIVLIYMKRTGTDRPGGFKRQSKLSSFISPPKNRSTLGAAGPGRGDVIDNTRISKLYRIKEQLDKGSKQ